MFTTESENLDGVLGPNRKQRTNAAAYVGLYPFLRDVAGMYGYALAVHGSMANDFDLVAVPWVETAVPAETLVEKLCEVLGGKKRLMNHGLDGEIYEQPADRPHGRKAWIIHLGGGPHIDISVMPLVEKAIPPGKNPEEPA